MSENKSLWGGGTSPFKASYGKLFMWFFLISDALTFSGFLISYAFTRYKHHGSWPSAEEVFTHFPGFHGDNPLLYVALMTFILIMSSVTMVLAVHHGNKMKKKAVAFWLFLTIIGGAMFVGSQAWEWYHFIHGDYGAIKTSNNSILHIIDKTGHKVNIDDIISNNIIIENGEVKREHNKKDHHDSHSDIEDHHDSHSDIEDYHGKHGTTEDFIKSINNFPDLDLRLEESVATIEKFSQYNNYQNSYLDKTPKSYTKGSRTRVCIKNEDIVRYLGDDFDLVFGANLKENEYGKTQFANYFFFITGFHGFHVFSGVVINIIIFIMVIKNILHRRGHYEMVEKVGLYWHFVDLVWVFVFTLFYLI